MWIYLATAIVLILYMVLAWFTGSWLHLQGSTLWLVRIGLSAIGVVGAGLFLWFHRKLTRDSGDTGAGPGAPVLTEIDALLEKADQKLKSSKPTAGASLRTLPIVFLLGEPNSAKTSTMLHSGLDPELLAGVIYHETETVPTNTLNIWFARGTVFIEVGGAILGEARPWARILSRTSRPGMSSAFGKSEAAPRAVVICCDCERLQAGNEKLVASARKLSGPLQSMANSLGASFPVYVLFTKVDAITKFADFVSNLTGEEARQILGTTVAQRDPRQGVFAEEEKNRLGSEFDQLVYSLAEKRLDHLSRENVAAKVAAAYEFPREFRKRRDQALSFLVEISRPSQLGTNPFLRGFYFSGVRPVTVRENVAAPAIASVQNEQSPGATRVFSPASLSGNPAGVPANFVRSRRVPEWTFLPYLFSEVILRDRAALGTSSRSSKTNAIRRILLGVLAVLFCCSAVAFLISFINNRRLQQEVMAANQTLAATVPGPVDVPTADQLKQLDHLRGTLTFLESNHKVGPPLSYRFGLYSGEELYPHARGIYFEYFRRLLLDSTQKSMSASLQQLPAKPSATDPYQEPYTTLKAYLITTLFHEHSSKDFLAPALLSRWPAGKSIDPERSDLARHQFEYYSDALVTADPYSSQSDRQAVGAARSYLRQFNNGIERVYQAMLAEADKTATSVNFNQQYPASRQVVINSYRVDGGFTKEGFASMQKFLEDPGKFSGGDEWVLGEKNTLTMSKEDLQKALRDRYYSDLVNQWRSFLRATRIVPYGSLKDAAGKLEILSANSSPLLQLFWIAGKNTNLDIPNMAAAFQPLQSLTKDSTAERLISPANQPYMDKLQNLQSSVAMTATSTAPQPDAGPVLSAAAAASGTVGTISQGFQIDNQAHVDAIVKKLMQDPITYAENSAGKVGPDALNKAGREFCSGYNAVASKYPFSPAASSEATMQEVANIFQPGGALWMFYDSNLKSILMRQGSRYVMNPSAPMHVSQGFISFLSHAAEVSDSFYPASSQQLRFAYTLRQLPSRGIEKLNLTIDGVTLTGENQSKEFVWTGNTNSVVRGTYSASSSPFVTEQGLWAPFHMADEARWTSTSTLEWPLEVGQSHRPQTLSDGTPMVIRYELMTGLPMFRRDTRGMRCPGVGAR